MYCEVIAYTVTTGKVRTKLGYDGDLSPLHAADVMAEYAGRNCYQSWSKKNPKTATNAGYLANIIDHQHFSVMEHASLTFELDGVSRSLLAELTRHRHLSFSVESQRYVPQTGREPVIPPLLRNDESATALLTDAYECAVQTYIELVEHLLANRDQLTTKQIREAARAALPNCQPVALIVTGNIRAWREVITKRFHIAADAEIQELAGEILGALRFFAPNSVADLPEDPYGNEEIRRAA